MDNYSEEAKLRTESNGPAQDPFILTIRQRRLRLLTGVILAVIAILIIISYVSPFFHPIAPAITTDKIRRAFKVQALLIWCYYSFCFLMTFSLVIIAWLYTREVRYQMLMARRDIFRDMAKTAPGEIEPETLINDK